MQNKKISILAFNSKAEKIKIALFENTQKIWEKNLNIPKNNFKDDIEKAVKFWREKIIDTLNNNKAEINKIDFFTVEDKSLNPLKEIEILEKNFLEKQILFYKKTKEFGNLLNLVVYDLAVLNDKKVYINNFLVSHNLPKIASFSGLKEIEKLFKYNSLYQKDISLSFCKEKNLLYDKVNLITCYIDDEISIAAHKKGEVIDVNDSYSEGPFGCQHSGSLPSKKVLEMAFKKSSKEVIKVLKEKSGIFSYLGTNNFKLIMDKIVSKPEYKLIIDAMIYQIAQEIGRRAVNLKGKVDIILLTGYISENKYFSFELKKYIHWISTSEVFNWNRELEVLVSKTITFINV